MATAKTSEEEMVTCSICFETYRNPKYLPCLHTFCETCLSEYITSAFLKASSSTADKNKGFPCPICRLDVSVSDSSLTPENIAARMPANHLIVTLLDQNRLKSKDKPCDPCLALEKQNTAVSWCTVCNESLCLNCENIHRVMKMSKNHKICPLEEIKSETKSITTLDFCEQHEEEKIKLYCMDHEQPCCAICVTVHHRKCEHVKTLNDAAKGIQESPDLKELNKCLKLMIDELSTVLEGRKSNLQVLEKEKQQYQEKITKMRQDINKHLDLLQEKLNQELNGRYKECSILIGSDIDEIESNLKVISNYQTVLEAGLKNVSDIHMFLEMNKIKQQHCERSETLKKRLEEMKNHEIEIRLEDSWVNLISNLTKIGTVVCTSTPLDDRSGIFGKKYMHMKNLQNCIAKKIYSFNTGEFLSSGTFLPNGEVMLVDWRGRKIIVCTLEGRVQKKLSLSGSPWGIVQIDDRKAAILSDNTTNIQYIDIVNFKLDQLVEVNKQLYRGIGYNGTDMIILGGDGNIYMIDGNGSIIKTAASGYNGTFYITCDADRIFLTRGHELVCLDMNGSQIFRYTNSNFVYGQGISYDKEGNIYCCGWRSGNIHQLTPDGQFIKLIVTGITYPRGIAFDENGERFLVTHDGGHVSVYELSQP